MGRNKHSCLIKLSLVPYSMRALLRIHCRGTIPFPVAINHLIPFRSSQADSFPRSFYVNLSIYNLASLTLAITRRERKKYQLIYTKKCIRINHIIRRSEKAIQNPKPF